MFAIKYKIALVALMMWLATGCKKDGLAPEIDRTTAPRTIGEFIQNNYDLSLLNAALKKAGLMDTLMQPGSFTFFAPDNAAFNNIGIGSEADFDKLNTDSLRHALRYHLLRERYFVSGFPVQLDNKYITATGEPAYISVATAYGSTGDAAWVSVNGAFVSAGAKRNIGLANGVIHLVRKPLQYNTGTVQDYLSKNPNLELFVAAMKRFGLWDEMATKPKITVYAPDNAAFLSRGLTKDSIGKMNPANYKQLAFGIYPMLMQTRHVFSTDGYLIGAGGVLYGDAGIRFGDYSLIPNYQYNGYNNTESATLGVAFYSGGWWVSNDKGPSSVTYSGSGTSGADRLTENGIVHLISDLLFYPELMKN